MSFRSPYAAGFHLLPKSLTPWRLKHLWENFYGQTTRLATSKGEGEWEGEFVDRGVELMEPSLSQ